MMALHMSTTQLQSPQAACRATSFTSCCPLGGASVMRRQQALRLRRVAVRAEGEEQKSSGGTDALFASGSGKVEGALTYGRDTENFEDVFAFAGELPERLNGRVAMWAFAALALGEWQSGKTTLQQATEHPVAAVMFSLLISIASLAPKFAAGRSLKDLHGAANRDGLPRILAFFNKTHELWVGRVAMIGLVGLGVLEAVRGTPLF